MTFEPGLYRRAGGRGKGKAKPDTRTTEERLLDRVDKRRRYDAAKIVAQTFTSE